MPAHACRGGDCALSVLRRAITLIVVLAILAGGGYLVRMHMVGGQKPAGPVYATAKSVRGTMTADVVGFGPLQPAYLNTLQVTAGGTVQQVFVHQGDLVKKGELIAILANPTLSAKLSQDKAKLEEDERILASTLGVPLSQALKAATAAGDVTVTAPQAGRITEIRVNAGDAVTQGQALAQVVDDAQVTVSVNLLPFDRSRVPAGSHVQIRLQDFSGSITGVVRSVSANPVPEGGATSSASAGGPYLVYPATIAAPNPGLVAPGMKGTIAVREGGAWTDLSEAATVTSYGHEDQVNSPIDGTVETIAVPANSWVSAGQPLLTIGGAAASTALAGLAANVQQDEAQVQQDEQEQQGLTVRSDIAGAIAYLNARPGMTVRASEPIGTVFDNSRMTLTIQVNELEVANVKPGQDVVITSPGLPGRTFEGKVVNVSAMGQSNNSGLATFGVQIDVSGTSALKPGMTANARIVVATVRNALMVPVEAVVQSGKQTEVEVLRNGKPVFVPVKVGLVNDTQAQITSGLTAGEVVVTGSSAANLATPAAATSPPGAGVTRPGTVIRKTVPAPPGSKGR